MFLKYFMFKQLPFRSNASRKILYFKNKFCLQIADKHLTTTKLSKAGRNVSGKIVLWTRGSLRAFQKKIHINYNWRYNRLCFIGTFYFIPFTNKLLSLILYANGTCTYILTSELHTLFNYIYIHKIKKFRRYSFSMPWGMLFFLKKLIFISHIELIPGKGAQYCKATGTKAKLMYVDKKLQLAFIQLPSKIKKFFSSSSFVFLGQMALMDKKFYYNTKSGYWRNFGLKSQVRGVAMNPVDHPHGGRTKAVKFQKTPWGFPTKYK